MDQRKGETMLGDFEGKIAIVTGGSMGMGKAVAARLAVGGASVMLCGRRPDAVRAMVAELSGGGLAVAGMPVDVSRSDEVERLVRATVEQFGGVDILVNSAGVQRYGTVVDTEEAVWDEVFDINVKGMYLTSRFAIPEMRKRGGGVIVNVSSVQAFASQTSVAAYTASKGAINALTRAMALDHAPDNIRVVAVCPASVDTPMLRWAADVWRGDETNDAMIEAWGKMHPIGRVGTGEEVAEMVAFLAGPNAGFITGSEHKIDGGLLAGIAVALPD
jgi:NAD(P)-dependent dehydrogenase (short-subunit alcohol dehydrogenase family)